MRPLACACLLALSACYPLRNARFVDESQNAKNTAWICVPDDEEPLNAGGIMCADLKNLRAAPVEDESGPNTSEM